MKSRYIGCVATILVRHQRTPDSSSPHRITPEEHKNSHSWSPFRQCSFDPVTDKQTNELILFCKTLLSVEGTRSSREWRPEGAPTTDALLIALSQTTYVSAVKARVVFCSPEKHY